MTVDGDPVNGKFNDAAPIPVTMGTEHLLSFTIDFGDMLMSYDFTDTSADNNYGWGDSFKNGNNKLTLTNNSTCPVNADITLNIDTETYPYFCLNNNNENDVTNSSSYKRDIIPLSYYDDQKEGAITSFDTYLNVRDSSKLTDMHNYNFNNAKIGEITIELTPVFGTIPTEEGYYVKVTEVSSDPMNFLFNLIYLGYSEEELKYEPADAQFIIEMVFYGMSYYLGPYETEDEADSMKTRLDACSTCSVRRIATEEGYFVKVTAINDPDRFYSILTGLEYSEEEAIFIYLTVYNGIPYYLGPYATEDEANSIKTQLDESSTCSIIQI